MARKAGKKPSPRSEYQKQYYENNKAKRQEYFKEYYKNNKEKIKTRNKARYEKLKEEVKNSITMKLGEFGWGIAIPILFNNFLHKYFLLYTSF